MAVAKSPAVLVAKSLGSCVAIALYDPAVRVGAMASVDIKLKHTNKILKDGSIR